MSSTTVRVLGCSVCSLSQQRGFSEAAEYGHGGVHGQLQGPGVQQPGSALHSALLSAYPFAPLIAQLVSTNGEKSADFSSTRFGAACWTVVVEFSVLFP